MVDAAELQHIDFNQVALLISGGKIPKEVLTIEYTRIVCIIDQWISNMIQLSKK